MKKYLFTDGTNGVREVQSLEELKTLISSSAQPATTRIWLFRSNEWVSYADFLKGYEKSAGKPLADIKKDEAVIAIANPLPHKPSAGKYWLKKFLFLFAAVAVIFLIYNFTKVNWGKAAGLSFVAPRPDNVPVMNVDSLIQYLEESRGKELDRVTKTNLRIRNDWPERIVLQLNADRDTSSLGTRYSNIILSVDNSTGYNIDNATVKLSSWKNGELGSSDTFHFNNIGYVNTARRTVKGYYKGDSLSVSFQSIRGKIFNFCYSDDKKSNYGNNNDRWFCRE